MILAGFDPSTFELRLITHQLIHTTLRGVSHLHQECVWSSVPEGLCKAPSIMVLWLGMWNATGEHMRVTPRCVPKESAG